MRVLQSARRAPKADDTWQQGSAATGWECPEMSPVRTSAASSVRSQPLARLLSIEEAGDIPEWQGFKASPSHSLASTSCSISSRGSSSRATMALFQVEEVGDVLDNPVSP